MAKLTKSFKGYELGIPSYQVVRYDLMADLEFLFDDFYQSLRGTFEELEHLYPLDGLIERVFGPQDHPDDRDDDVAIQTQNQRRREQAHLKDTIAWHCLQQLHDYALNGQPPTVDGPDSVVIDASAVLLSASGENWSVHPVWHHLVAMGDARFALEDGQQIELSKLALLARVDIRTVRNAISAGDLVAEKTSDGTTFIDNGSARSWLRGRRGFKPTVTEAAGKPAQLADVHTPPAFGEFLRQSRVALGIELSGKKVMVAHAAVTNASLLELEAGVFHLPLDAVFPLADFYQVSRPELLAAVMRTFFHREWAVLQGDAARGGVEG